MRGHSGGKQKGVDDGPVIQTWCGRETCSRRSEDRWAGELGGLNKGFLDGCKAQDALEPRQVELEGRSFLNKLGSIQKCPHEKQMSRDHWGLAAVR